MAKRKLTNDERQNVAAVVIGKALAEWPSRGESDRCAGGQRRRRARNLLWRSRQES